MTTLSFEGHRDCFIVFKCKIVRFCLRPFDTKIGTLPHSLVYVFCEWLHSRIDVCRMAVDCLRRAPSSIDVVRRGSRGIIFYCSCVSESRSKVVVGAMEILDTDGTSFLFCLPIKVCFDWTSLRHLSSIIEANVYAASRVTIETKMSLGKHWKQRFKSFFVLSPFFSDTELCF